MTSLKTLQLINGNTVYYISPRSRLDKNRFRYIGSCTETDTQNITITLATKKSRVANYALIGHLRIQMV